MKMFLSFQLFILVILASFNHLYVLCHVLDGLQSTPEFQQVSPENDISDVHIIFMNHLDVGYSDYSHTGLVGNVLNSYFTKYFPEAIKRATELIDGGYVETFKYTTHPFLLDLYLNCPPNLAFSGIQIKCPNNSEVMSMHSAINRGLIQWHAGAMNIQYELLTPIGIDLSLSLSSRLDKMFSAQKKLRVLSQRDVPGISRGIIPHLVSNNVLGISHGINSGSATSAVPPIFRWRQAPPYDSSGAKEVLYVQNKGGYPMPPGKDPNHPWGLADDQCFRAPTTSHVLCFSFRTDNTGPPESLTEVLHTYEILRARYPHAHLYASSLEKYFEILDSVREHIPIVDREIGDTWIQGAVSDPRKMSDYKSISNALDQCFLYKECVMEDSRIANASRFFVKLAEHTWGLDSDHDSIHWKNEEFEKIRNNKNFKKAENAWNEQRSFVNLTLTALRGHPVVSQIMTNMQNTRLPPGAGQPPDLHEFTRTSSYNFTCGNHNFLISKDGTIQLKDIGSLKILYRTYNETDTKFFLKYYSMGWNTGYGKPNSTVNAAPQSKFWTFLTDSVYVRNNNCDFYVRIRPVNTSAVTYYGAPTSFWLRYVTKRSIMMVDSVTIEWFDKKPTRLMEAIYLQFLPDSKISAQREFFFSKINSLISPYNVVQNGSQWQHGIDSNGVIMKCRNPGRQCPDFSIESVNTYLVCPITKSYGPTVWPVPLNPIVEKIVGIAFPLYTNVWMTNYIFWYPYFGPDNVNDKAFKTEFILRMKSSSSNLFYRPVY